MGREEVFGKFHLDNPELLGKGGEGDVFAIDSEKVLKIYRLSDLKYLQMLAVFQERLTGYKFPFSTPQILEYGELSGECFSVEKRLNGQVLDKKLPTLSESQKQTALLKYFEAMMAISSARFDDSPFGQILTCEGTVRSDTWPEFLLAKLDQQIHISRAYLTEDVANFVDKERRLRQVITSELESREKRLVHGDYYLNNVLVDDDLNITSVLDFSVHCAVGDPRLDAASILFLKLDPHVQDKQLDLLYGQADKVYGLGTGRVLDIYGMYYSIYYAGTHDRDPVSYAWSVNNLNNEQVWQSLGL